LGIFKRVVILEERITPTRTFRPHETIGLPMKTPRQSWRFSEVHHDSTIERFFLVSAWEPILPPWSPIVLGCVMLF
jgi:hypothetical protein